MINLVAAIFAAALALAPLVASADANHARAIAERIDNSYSGYGTSTANGRMTLYAGGRTAERSFQTRSLEARGAIDEYSVLVFQEPRDMAGVALLTHAMTEPSADLQWLYVPAGGRIKRISSNNKSGNFVSSEFSYEDFAKQDIDEFTYGYVGTENCPGTSMTCEVIEAYPRSQNSGYSKRVIWADTQEWRPQMVEFFNRRGAHEKTVYLSDYERPGGVKWRPMVMDMRNHLNGRRTVMQWSNYRFGQRLDPNDFSSERLHMLAR
jgi:outer membrane lipoprotein-sorting protein